MERKDIFNKIIDFVSSKKKLHKISHKDSFIAYSFHDYETPIYKNLAENIKNKIKCDTTKINMRAYKEYLCVSFDRRTGYIKITRFEVGYDYSPKKNAYYPYSKKTHMYSYTDKIYGFMYKGRRNFKLVRPVLGSALNYSNPIESQILKIMSEIIIPHPETTYTLPVTLKYYKNTSNEFDVIKNRTGITIPKALRVFFAHQLYDLVRVLKNPNELNSLCQTLSKGIEFREVTNAEIFDSNDIYSLLSKHMGLEGGNTWLLRDYITDLVILKKKFSLKMTSYKRIEEEHRRLSKLRMLKGVKKIKTHEHYVEFAKSLPETIELINDKVRLIDESTNQSHCVATYANKINNGECCILSTKYENEQYTIEIISQKHGEDISYYINQCRGKFNKPAPTGLIQELTKYNTSLLIPQYTNYGI